MPQVNDFSWMNSIFFFLSFVVMNFIFLYFTFMSSFIPSKSYVNFCSYFFFL